MMKRYRVSEFDFDSRARILDSEIEDSWDEPVKQQHLENKRKLEATLLDQFGKQASEQKRRDFTELGSAPFSILAFHNKFLRQIRTAFVMGAYYPALTASCTLGERILNHLVIVLREDYKGTAQYKRVYQKKSFDNWTVPINILETWGVLLPKATSAFRSLWEIRNLAVHFDPAVDSNDRTLALKAIKLLNQAIQEQFSALGSQPWFIAGVRGESYIKKQVESQPFVKRVYLPKCVYVGPYHTLVLSNKGWIAEDNNEYDDREITDDEFVRLRQQGKPG